MGGFAKGFKLETLNSLNTRPTSAMLKRKIFDSFQSLHEYEFLDLCAGSGSIGLEALSRDALSLSMCESDQRAYKVLKTNAQNFKKRFNSTRVEVVKSDFKIFLKKFHFDNSKKYFIFFDPPYEKIDLYEKFFELINEIQINGIVVIEACAQKTKKIDDFETRFGKFDKMYKQGTSYFGLYHKYIEG